MQEEPMDYTDEQLLQQMADDDRQAFAILYQRYWESLFVTAAKALGKGKRPLMWFKMFIFLYGIGEGN